MSNDKDDIVTARVEEEEEDFMVMMRTMDPEDLTPADRKRLTTPPRDPTAEAIAKRANSVLWALSMWGFLFIIMVLVSGALHSSGNRWTEESRFPEPEFSYTTWATYLSSICLLMSLFTVKGFHDHACAAILIFTLYLATGVMALFAGGYAFVELDSYLAETQGSRATEYQDSFHIIIIVHILGGLGMTLCGLLGLFVGAMFTGFRPVPPTTEEELELRHWDVVGTLNK